MLVRLFREHLLQSTTAYINALTYSKMPELLKCKWYNNEWQDVSKILPIVLSSTYYVLGSL